MLENKIEENYIKKSMIKIMKFLNIYRDFFAKIKHEISQKIVIM